MLSKRLTSASLSFHSRMLFKWRRQPSWVAGGTIPKVRRTPFARHPSRLYFIQWDPFVLGRFSSDRSKLFANLQFSSGHLQTMVLCYCSMNACFLSNVASRIALMASRVISIHGDSLMSVSMAMRLRRQDRWRPSCLRSVAGRQLFRTIWSQMCFS